MIWLRELGRVAWWIADGEGTLALGYVESDELPDEARIGEAQRAAEQRCRELGS